MLFLLKRIFTSYFWTQSFALYCTKKFQNRHTFQGNEGEYNFFVMHTLNKKIEYLYI
jgi:hypothetical protein